MAATLTEPKPGTVVARTRLTWDKLIGKAGRWRRFGEFMPPGTPDETGKPDYGILGGPGSISWEVMLHPATIVFLNSIQGLVQTHTFKPIAAGLRDRDPITRKALTGKLTVFDVYERAARSPGMHAPMWMGDTATARQMAEHLHKIHQRVRGDVIDVGRPELGGYAASEPREAMWAAITELHPMLWAYEAFAFRGGWLPRRLKPEQRDQFVKEFAPYLRLVGANEDEIPHTMAELQALYAKYEPYFRPSATINIRPENGEDHQKLVARSIAKNFDLSQLKALFPVLIQFVFLKGAMTGAVSGKARWSMGVKPSKGAVARRLFLPIAFLMQLPPIERYFLRRVWGPDATNIIMTGRRLHKQALADRKSRAA